MAELVLDLGWIANRAGDFFPQQLPIPLAQALNFFAQCCLVRSQLACQHGVRLRRLFTCEICFERLEMARSSRTVRLLAQTSQHLLQERKSPASLVYLLGRLFRG